MYRRKGSADKVRVLGQSRRALVPDKLPAVVHLVNCCVLCPVVPSVHRDSWSINAFGFPIRAGHC